MDEKDLHRECCRIADIVVPKFRVTARRSCTSQAAKQWNAAYKAVYIALTGEPWRPAVPADQSRSGAPQATSLGEVAPCCVA